MFSYIFFLRCKEKRETNGVSSDTTKWIDRRCRSRRAHGMVWLFSFIFIFSYEIAKMVESFYIKWNKDRFEGERRHFCFARRNAHKNNEHIRHGSQMVMVYLYSDVNVWRSTLHVPQSVRNLFYTHTLSMALSFLEFGQQRVCLIHLAIIFHLNSDGMAAMTNFWWRSACCTRARTAATSKITLFQFEMRCAAGSYQ